jgi:hypothetical protein
MVIKFWSIYSGFLLLGLFLEQKMESLSNFSGVYESVIVLISYVLTRDVIKFLASHKTLQLFSLDSEVLVD